jgi:hypothetical protein
MKDSKLLRLLVKSGKERIKYLKKNNLILKPITKKYLPVNTYLRSWYNQAYLSFYMGMPDGSLSLIFLIIERITRDTYNVVIENPKNESKIHWDTVLNELESYFKKYKRKQKELDAIKLVRWMKDKGRRNKHQHSDVEAILRRYNLKAWEFDIGSKRIESTVLAANSKIIPSQIQVRTKHKISDLTVAFFLNYLPYVIKSLYKYKKI